LSNISISCTDVFAARQSHHKLEFGSVQRRRGQQAPVAAELRRQEK
jgi:hypothetical protein